VSYDDYREAIENWHNRAENEKEPFIRFILEYISFISLLSNVLKGKNDRDRINILKSRKKIKELLLNKVDETKLTEIVEYLQSDPILNVTQEIDNHWERGIYNIGVNGTIRDIEDYPNIIEFIYRARNNLIHGQKRLEVERDKKIVELAYEILHALVEVFLQHENISFLLTQGEKIKYTCHFCEIEKESEEAIHQHVTAKHLEEFKLKM